MKDILKVVLTLVVVVLPNVLILQAMGWTSLAHTTLSFAWALVSSALIALLPTRHRVEALSKWIVLVTLALWVFFVVMFLASGWDARAVLSVLLVLPGLNFLALDALSLTPSSASRLELR